MQPTYDSSRRHESASSTPTWFPPRFLFENASCRARSIYSKRRSPFSSSRNVKIIAVRRFSSTKWNIYRQIKGKRGGESRKTGTREKILHFSSRGRTDRHEGSQWRYSSQLDNPDLVAVVYQAKDREIEWWNQRRRPILLSTGGSSAIPCEK